MLCFDFTIVHRPERMLFECNLLSRYNSWTSKLRQEDRDPDNKQTYPSLEAKLVEQSPSMDKSMYCVSGMASRYSMIGLQPVGASHVPIPVQGPNTTLQSTVASHCDLHRYVACISSSGYSTIDSVLLHTSHHIATDEWWIEETNHVSSLKFLQNLKERTFDWLWVEMSEINPIQHHTIEKSWNGRWPATWKRYS
jgi:hypothetical protein